MSLSPELIAVIGTLGGAIVGAISASVAAIVNKHSEERKHFRALVVNAALENWKHISSVSQSRVLFPLEHYIVHTTKMCELALDNKLTPKNTKQKLDEIDAVMKILAEHAVNVSTKRKEA